MSRTIVFELFLPFRLFKKTANIRCTTTSAQILNSHENKTKWRVALKRKKGAAAKHLLIESWNHGTMEPKKSQIYGGPLGTWKVTLFTSNRHLVTVDRHLVTVDRHLVTVDRHLVTVDRHLVTVDRHLRNCR